MAEDTQIGPLATESGRDDVEELRQGRRSPRAPRVVVGGKRPDGPGWFYPPTLLTGITAGDAASTPRRSSARSPRCSPSPTSTRRIEIANSHPYGLGSNLWSEDEDERAQFVRDVASGMAFINGMTTSYPELPFGGVKQSGYGRELTELGHAGVHERQDRLGRGAGWRRELRLLGRWARGVAAA